MKRLLIISFIALFVSVSSFAQKNATPEQKAQRKVENMDKNLSLSSEQKEKLTALFSKGGDKKAEKAEVKNILTAEQYEKYEAAQKEKKANSNKGGEKEKSGKKGGKKNKS